MAARQVFGGTGYRWRGKAIRTIYKGNSAGVMMQNKESMIMAPCSVDKDATYRVTIMASGNGSVMVNFFGGQNYDAGHVAANIIGGSVGEYALDVKTPDFPPNTPIYLRVWRTDGAVGDMFIKTISCEPIEQASKTQRPLKLRPPIPTPPTPPESKKAAIKEEKPNITKPRVNRRAPKQEEKQIMKSLPYQDVGTATGDIQKAMVNKAEDVPRVSIITPTRDGIDLIKNCYKALNDNTNYPNWEWIVGDSKSVDGTVEYLKALNDTRIKIVERTTTEGSFSSINNELVEFATGEYLLFLNNDTEPQPFWLFEMMSKIHQDKDIGVVGARLMYDKDRIQHAGIAFIPQGPANLGFSVLGSFPVGFAAHDRYLQAVTGACLLMRTKDFKDVGGFDPIYYFCYEDVDLCLKVRKQLSKKVLYAANAIVIHAESITQNKYKTGGEKQGVGIRTFKERWMNEVEIDFPLLQRNIEKGQCRIDVSFVTCVNDLRQYTSYIIGSLFKNMTSKKYEIIPILNIGNPYSAAKALNVGIDKARADIVVLCHQDVIFYKNWVELLFERISEIEKNNKKWGVLGTAGIDEHDNTIGVIHSMNGGLGWHSNKRATYYPVQTVDEHCMVIRKSNGVRFDDALFDGFHCYGPDLCLTAITSGFENFGILCPLVHASASGSLASGREEFMRLLNVLAKKWRPSFKTIRTTTSIINKKSLRTFIQF